MALASDGSAALGRPNWDRQTHMLNEMVMDWRWKTCVAEVDCAQRRTTYVEYLLPLMEIGLLHANITQQQCDAWMSTVIHTICIGSGMATIHSLSR